MKRPLLIALAAALTAAASTHAQRGGPGPRPNELGARPLPVGKPGIAWYTTWDTALAEAERSGRPIFFMAAAAQCGGVPGVF